jgi:GcrA cell cycle regulator
MPKLMGNQNAATWSDGDVDTLKSMWTEGASASEIAAALGKGISRAAVLGKVHRLKLPSHARQPGSTLPKPHGNKGQPKVNAVVAAARARIAPPSEPFDAEADIGIDVTKRVGIMDLTGHTCRWPIGRDTGARQMFCGCHADLIATGPYCPEHTAKAENRR